jgi:hypothetical protein
MIIIKQQQHIEHLAPTKTQKEKEHIISLFTCEKRPLNIKPECGLLIPNSKPKPCLLHPKL